MRAPVLSSFLALVLGGAPSVALAQVEDVPVQGDPTGAPAPAPPAEAPLVLHHKHQGNVRLTVGSGYRFIVPYEDAAICGPPTEVDPGGDTSPCESRAPFFLDIDAGFGASEGVELTVMLRLGLEYEDEDFHDAYPLVLGPGIRLYPSPESRVKLFLAFRILFDFTKIGPQLPGREVEEKTDVALRGEPGLQVEINRNAGVFLQTGVTFGAVRWFHFEADAGLGFQLRFP